MFCDQCGTENPTQNKYCGQCGAKLESANGRETESLASEPLHAPAGPVFSAFRREVEQQQLRLQRLEAQPVKSYSDLATSAVDNPADAETIVDRPPETKVQETATRENAGDVSYSEPSGFPADEETISGPSFLGLSGPEPAAQNDLTYLYEDDVKPGRARKLLALVIALGFIAFMVYEWRQNPNWQTAIVGKLRKPSTTAATTSGPPPQNPTPEPGSSPARQENAPATTTASQGGAPNESATGAQEANAPSKSPSTASESAPQSGVAGPGSTKQEQAGPPQAVRPKNDVAAGDTDSTGAAGEQEAADTENANNDAADKSKSVAHVAAGATKGTASRNSAAARPAKTEEPDNALVQKADAYLYGRGVPKDCRQALVYLRTAADRGNATARSKLGGLYATGHCVPLDRAEAYNWFTLSRDAGANNVWVQRNREILWSKMTADEKARAMEPPR